MLRISASCILVLFLVGATAGQFVLSSNVILDKLIGKLQKSDALKLMPLENLEVGLDKKVGLVRVNAGSKLHDGYITGLETIHRNGNSTLEIHSDGSKKLKCNLGMGAILLSYTGTVSFMDFEVSVKMNGRSGYIAIDVEVGNKGDEEIKLQKFKISEMADIQVKFSGLGPITWIGNLLIAPTIKLLKPVVESVIQIRAKKVIEKKLSSLLKKFNLN